MRRIIIVDAYNYFLRAYHAFPSMSSNGHQVGGTVGFIKSLRRTVEDYRPDMVVIVWESGGSARRRSIYSEYKMHRRPEKLNRFYEDDIPDSKENELHQTKLLINLLRYVPVCQMYVADCEADDIIAKLCRTKFKDDDKIILSADRDFYQLLDVEKTTIYNPKRKVFIGPADVKKEFGVSAKNFALSKAVCGDGSDNVPGVPSVGFKTLVKRIPTFALDEPILLDDVILFCQSRREEHKFYSKMVEHEDFIRRNWKLVNLDGNILTMNQIDKMNYIIDNYEPVSQKLKFMELVVEDGIKDLHIDDVFFTFAYLAETSKRNDGE